MPSTPNDVASSGREPMTRSLLRLQDAVHVGHRVLGLRRRLDREHVVVLVLEMMARSADLLACRHFPVPQGMRLS